MDKNTYILEHLEHIEQQLADNPQDEMLWLYKGICYLDLEDRPGTIRAMTQGMIECPHYGRLLEERGHRYINVGEYEKAAADLELACTFYPHDHSIHYHRGLAHYFQAEYLRAEQSFRCCVNECSVFGDTVSAVNWLWYCLVHQEKFAEAEKLLECIPSQANENVEGVAGYFHMLLMYKGLRTPEETLANADPNPVGYVTTGYGVYNYYKFIAGEDAKAEALLDSILSEEPQPWQRGAQKHVWQAGFGYRAAATERLRRTLYPD
ncbi:hypothetical protein DW651_19670 [Subdoligranulum sp. AM23-21AC]|jgi:tetratricopeptide (TPR) repeat protein|uniref:tetratricopeptide repeat protein n=1 Tax=Ruthenibacterium lactatiformans TaxID=1550024 RepID=UPI000E3F55ED|nr:hypothetical protein [Ruthenibacterium lactatiformans]RGC96963.1 hypothetical protein DW194_18565 [Subdoligranulum sp. AM16-9]RGD16409.1 hypothetical protein DW651_19670 [Subdoligranulum sp. AM23-21AC]